MKNDDWNKIFQAIGLFFQLGIVMIVNIGFAFWLGSLLDKIVGTNIIFKIIGMLLGVISGFYSDYKLIKKISDDF